MLHRACSHVWMGGKFHVHPTTAYTLLRHNGVELGKMDLPLQR